jgi:KipI family sensor histidine kinase inhibitor
MSGFRIVPAGDSALFVEFDNRIDPAVNARAVALAERLRAAPIAGVRDIVPTYRSVTIYFDPVRTPHDPLVELLEREAARQVPEMRWSPDVIRVPVCYGGEFGPDLPEVAGFAGIAESAVIDLHATPTYRVFMLGFVPGFAYLGNVDERIAMPRRATPRVRVPRGTVAIAGTQTGIYPSETPGGWHLIGRTPTRPFDLSRPNPCLLKAGDGVSFQPIDRAEYDRLESAARRAAP